MNNRAHWVSALVFVTHLLIGISGLFDIGPRFFLPPSWVVIYSVLPANLQLLYPAMWALTGVVGLLGIRSPGALRVGFYMSSALFLMWGLAGIPAQLLNLGGNPQGTAANLYTAGLAWLATYYVTIGVRGDSINEQVVRLAEVVYQAESDGSD